MKQLTWYFDVISPFAYLQFYQLQGLKHKLGTRTEDAIEIIYKPILFAGLLNYWENVGPAEIAPKRRFTYEHVTWRAKQMKVPFQMPPNHPFNPLAVLRLIIAAGNEGHVVEKAFQIIWRDGLDAAQPVVLQKLATSIGLRDFTAAVSTPKVKQELIENTNEAAENSVFGVPTCRIDQQNIWGVDAFDMVVAYLKDPDWFRSNESMRRARDLPVGIQRSS